jgi:FkbM family methyltransferase
VDARRLRPAKIVSALRRRWFERRLSRIGLAPRDDLEDLGGRYGGWTIPTRPIDSSWVCYCAGAGGDIKFELELIARFGVRVRCIEPVEEFVAAATADGGGDPRLSAHRAAIATADGPIRMQRTHDPRSKSVSAVGMYESDDYVEMPGRTVASLMSELGDERIDFLKLDIEGSEYDVVPTLDLHGIGARMLSLQLHHNRGVRGARRLIAQLASQGYRPVACRPAVKLTFLRQS